MYDFIDTNELNRSACLPSEAMNFNGSFLENAIKGYKTLTVNGRELMGKEIQENTINRVDGSEYLGKRYPGRTITVKYQLICENATAFREEYNKMNLLLSVEQAKIIFNDEPDKYFIGTIIDSDKPEPGKINIIGSFDIYCTDPFKYSTVKKEFVAKKNSDGILEVIVENDGSIAVGIDYEITHNSESGFIGIISEHGAMQYGYLEEADGTVKERSENLIDYTKASDYYSAVNNVIIPIGTESMVRNGTMTSTTVNGGSYLCLGNVGTGGWWHGASKTITLPTASNGQYSSNFYIKTKIWFETGLITQTGVIHFSVSDENKKELCTFSLQKWTRGNNDACVYLNSKELKFQPGYWSATAFEKGYISIRKSGELLEFVFDNQKYQFRDPTISNSRAKYISIYLGQFADGDSSERMLMSRLYFKELSFRSDGVDYFYDIPNRFKKGNICTINSSTGKYYVDGVYTPEDEILGTQYFKAGPGKTKIQFIVSDWTTIQPTVKVYIREAWL